MPSLSSSDVRLASNGNIYVPSKWPYILPTSARSALDGSWEPLGYISDEGITFEAAPRIDENGVVSDKLLITFEAAQVSTAFFQLLLSPYSVFIFEWVDDESDQYRFVVQRGTARRSMHLLRLSATMVRVECDVKQYALYTDNPSVDDTALNGTYR